MIKLSYGSTALGIWPTPQAACDFASWYLSQQGIHHQFDWDVIRNRARFAEGNMSVGIDGLMFNPKNLVELDSFGQAAVDMAQETEKLRQEYGPHGQHPYWERSDWCAEAARNDTQLGYWEWVVHRLQENEE